MRLYLALLCGAAAGASDLVAREVGGELVKADGSNNGADPSAQPDPHRRRTDCIPSRYRASNVRVVQGVPLKDSKDPSFDDAKPKFTVNGEEFEVRGVGYSPIPPGRDTYEHPFDYFTDDKKYIWKRDVPVIAKMGANLVRTWSWDATVDHTGFLDYCHDHNLKVMVPFLMNMDIYPGPLSDPDTRLQIMTDFRAFISKIKNHPALFGFMIGNELNEAYAGQFEELFSIVNAMVAIRDEVEGDNPHPITVPFSDSDFMKSLVKEYYPWLNIDFWSLQIYRDELDKVADEYKAFFYDSGNEESSAYDGLFQNLPVKPLVLTEYGLDALEADKCEAWNETCTANDAKTLMSATDPIPLDEEKQAKGFCERFRYIHSSTAMPSTPSKDNVQYLGGGVVMEYCDEWWKGQFADARRTECPNSRTDIHTYCAQNVNKHSNFTAYFLHEEWLGLFAQVPSLENKRSLAQFLDHCVQPRLSYCVLSKLFTRVQKNPQLNIVCDNTKDSVVQECIDERNSGTADWDQEYCGATHTISNNYIVMILAPMLLVCIFVILILHLGVGLSCGEIFVNFCRSLRLRRGDDETVRRDDELPPESPTASSLGKILAIEGSEPPLSPTTVDKYRALRENELLKVRAELNHIMWELSCTRHQHDLYRTWKSSNGSFTQPKSFSHFFEWLTKKQPCPYFVCAQDKLMHLITDNFERYTADQNADFYDQFMDEAVRIVFEKHTEGYYLYLSLPTELAKRSEMLRLLCMYFMVQQWAGTINHCPEKICELVDWTWCYFGLVAEQDKNEIGPLRDDNDHKALDDAWELRCLHVSDFHHGLVEIIRTYCMKIMQDKSFDDINADTLFVRKRKLAKKESVSMVGDLEADDLFGMNSAYQMNVHSPVGSRPEPCTMGTEGDLLPVRSKNPSTRSAIHGTHLEFNDASKPEDCVDSESARLFFCKRLKHEEVKKKKSGKSDGDDATMMEMKFFPDEFTFPLHGGVFSLFLNYQWLIRYVVWQNMFASYLQPTGSSACLQEFFWDLALVDCSILLLGYIFHYTLLGGRFKGREWREFPFHVVCCAVLYAVPLMADVDMACKFLDGRCEGNVAPTIDANNTSLKPDAALAYLFLTVVYSLFDEGRLFLLYSGVPMTIEGRKDNTSRVRPLRWIYLAAIIIFVLLFITLKLTGVYHFEAWDWWPSMDEFVLIVGLPVVCLGVAFSLAQLKIKTVYNDRITLQEESMYLLTNIIFWGLFFVANWLVAFEILIPSIDQVTPAMCMCHESSAPLLDKTQVERCEWQIRWMCNVGVIFVWLSAYIVSFVFLYAAFELLLLVVGFVVAKKNRIGNVKSWNDAERHWRSILRNSLPYVSKSLLRKRLLSGDTNDTVSGVSLEQALVWNSFVRSLQQDDLLSSDEAKAMRVSTDPTSCQSGQVVQYLGGPNFRVQPAAPEARRRIISFLWGLESLAAHARSGNCETLTLAPLSTGEESPAFTSDFRKHHRMSTMPSLTTLVPTYNEPVRLVRDQLRKQGKRISEIEYLSLTYEAEWRNFAEKICNDKQGLGSWMNKEHGGADLLHAFIGSEQAYQLDPKKDKDQQLIREVETWATMRGQTLWRTVQGLHNCRWGMEELAVLEEYGRMTPTAIMRMVSRKYQVLVSHQTCDLDKIGNKGSQENMLMETFRAFNHLELVTNNDSEFQSMLLRLRESLLYDDDAQTNPEAPWNKTQSSAQQCHNVIAQIKERKLKEINMQFQHLMEYQEDKTRTTVLSEGCMVRYTHDGVIVCDNPTDGDLPLSSDTKRIVRARWQEGTIVAVKRPDQQKESRTVSAQAINDMRGGGSAPVTEKALLEKKIKLVEYPNRGLFVARDDSGALSEGVSRKGWTITEVNKMPCTRIADLCKHLTSAAQTPVTIKFEKFWRWGDKSCVYTIKPDVPTNAMGGQVRETVREVQIPAERVRPWPFTASTVQRVSKLKIGEGKAENQVHALQFVRGDVLQAVDMNQYATADQALKLPFVLNDFFAVPDANARPEVSGDPSLIPPYRIVGFPEHCYTRQLSLTGELMGAAEWCFVTMTQRVLSNPLRMRLHYGHPDFFDAYWVRTRGGQSKASLKVNTNEDIFAGYELVGRLEKGSFVEFIEFHKGRETAFPAAYVFECKLAQGAAQQVRSLDVYRLNRKLNFMQRFSLFFGSLGFYVANFLMAISINYYILSIVLFSMSGVTYHQLGLLDAVIAIPWLLQVGYVLAFPMIVELIIMKGFWRGLGEFIVTLPAGIFFFIFHLRTKTYYFGKGLLVGAGGYASTGRGFGLDRLTLKELYMIFSESHFIEGLIITICLLIYAVNGTDPILPYLARTFTIMLIAMSWLWAPIFFNPNNGMQDLQRDLTELISWLSTDIERPTEKELRTMIESLKTVQMGRRLALEHNMDREAANDRSAGEIGDGAADMLETTSVISGGSMSSNSEYMTGANKDMEFVKRLYKDGMNGGEAAFNWKPALAGGFAKRAKMLIPDLESRKAQIIVTLLNTTPSQAPSGIEPEALKSALLQALELDRDPMYSDVIEFTEVSQHYPVWVLHCKSSDGEQRVKYMMGPECYAKKARRSGAVCVTIRDPITERDLTYNVKLEEFMVWAQKKVATFTNANEMKQQLFKGTDGKRDAADGSWKAWYWLRCVLEYWELEDEQQKLFNPFMKVTTYLVKFALNGLFYAPWLLIAFAFFHMESAWLLIVGAFFIVVFRLINVNTRDRHDYPQLLKALSLVMAPLLFVYFNGTLISQKELVWSVAFYFLCICVVTRTFMGIRNFWARDLRQIPEGEGDEKKDSKSKGLASLLRKDNSRTHSDDGDETHRLRKARRDDLRRLNKAEFRKAELLKRRLMINTDFGMIMRVLTPFCILVLLAIGNVLAVAFSGWVTAVVYNGRIAEVWKQIGSKSSAPASNSNERPQQLLYPVPGMGQMDVSQQKAILDSIQASVSLVKQLRPKRGTRDGNYRDSTYRDSMGGMPNNQSVTSVRGQSLVDDRAPLLS